MRIFGMCFQYGGQSSLRAKTVSIVFLIILFCIDTATSRISRFGGKNMSSLHTYSICVIKMSISKAIEQIPSENRRCSQNVTDHSC